MCHYFHSRLLEKRKEFGIFFVRKTKYITVDAWVCFRFVPPLFCSFFSFPFIIKSILISNKTPTSEGVLKLPARASGFEARNGFPVPQNITYSVRYQGGSLLWHRLWCVWRWFQLSSWYNHSYLSFGFRPILLVRSLLSEHLTNYFGNIHLLSNCKVQSFDTSWDLLLSLQARVRIYRDLCWLLTATVVRASEKKRPHVRETSPGKNDNFHPIYLLHLPCCPRAVSDFDSCCNLIRTTLALYELPVRQAGSLPPASFRFHLAVDTLALG